MTKTRSATEARVHLGELLDAIEHNETITVEHAGEAEAVVIPAEGAQNLSATGAGSSGGRTPVKPGQGRMRAELDSRTLPIDDRTYNMREEGGQVVHVIRPEEGDWKQALDRVRARMREELGDRTIDFDQIIHDMREERSAELFDNLRRRQSRGETD